MIIHLMAPRILMWGWLILNAWGNQYHGQTKTLQKCLPYWGNHTGSTMAMWILRTKRESQNHRLWPCILWPSRKVCLLWSSIPLGTLPPPHPFAEGTKAAIYQTHVFLITTVKEISSGSPCCKINSVGIISSTKKFRKSWVWLPKPSWALLTECSRVSLFAVQIDSDQPLSSITEERESQREEGNYHLTTSLSLQKTLISILSCNMIFILKILVSISYMYTRNCIHFHPQLISCSLPSCFHWISFSQVPVWLSFYSVCVNQAV